MLSSLCFLVVNSNLLLMLIGFLRNKDHIDFMFLTCLLFTFLGNATIGMSINTAIALINIILGIILFK